MKEVFQSTLPVWGATGAVAFGRRAVRISIHAPRVGSDVADGQRQQLSNHFNPRSTCGERHAGGKTQADQRFISIHAPRVGSDMRACRMPFGPRTFQSTLPVWGATPDHCTGLYLQ